MRVDSINKVNSVVINVPHLTLKYEELAESTASSAVWAEFLSR